MYRYYGLIMFTFYGFQEVNSVTISHAKEKASVANISPIIGQ